MATTIRVLNLNTGNEEDIVIKSPEELTEATKKALDPTEILTIGTVTAGATPSASFTGRKLNLVLPQGPKGEPGADGTMTFEELTQEQRDSLKGEQGIQGPTGPKGDNVVRFPVSDQLPQNAIGKAGDIWLYQETIDGSTVTYEITKQQSGWDLENMVRVTGDKGTPPMTYYLTEPPTNSLGVHGDIAKWTDVEGNRWETVKIGLEWDIAGKYLSGEGFNSPTFVNVTWAANITIDGDVTNKHKLTVTGDTTITITAAVGKAGMLLIGNSGGHNITFTGQVEGAPLSTEDIITWVRLDDKVVFEVVNLGSTFENNYNSTIPPYINVASLAETLKDGLIVDGYTEGWQLTGNPTIFKLDEFIPVKPGAVLHNQYDTTRYGGGKTDWLYTVKEYSAQKTHITDQELIHPDSAPTGMGDYDVKSITLSPSTKYIKVEVFMRNFASSDIPAVIRDYAIFSIHQNHVGKTVRYITPVTIPAGETTLVKTFTANGTKVGGSVIQIPQKSGNVLFTGVCDADNVVKIYATNRTSGSLTVPAQKITVNIQEI